MILNPRGPIQQNDNFLALRISTSSLARQRTRSKRTYKFVMKSSGNRTYRWTCRGATYNEKLTETKCPLHRLVKVTYGSEAEAKRHPLGEDTHKKWSTKCSEQHRNHVATTILDGFNYKSNCKNREHHGKENGWNETRFIGEKMAFTGKQNLLSLNTITVRQHRGHIDSQTGACAFCVGAGGGFKYGQRES